MVLDEPWRYTRVRIRLERNLRDVNENNIPDINPAFQMYGDFSNWSSHGREPVELDFRDLQARHLPVAPGDDLCVEFTRIGRVCARFTG